MVARSDPRRHGKNDEDTYELEERLLRAIEDRTVASSQELATIVGKLSDGFETKMWLLTLEGKGFIKKSESGYIVTDKGRHKLENNT